MIGPKCYHRVLAAASTFCWFSFCLTRQPLEYVPPPVNRHRSTSPRRAVVNAIAGQNKHFTAEELRGQLPGVGRATIYRSLRLLP